MLARPQEAETLARPVAAKVGTTPEQVLRDAVETSAGAAGLQMSPSRRRKTAAQRVAAILAISDRCAALPVLDDRTADEILGYDEFGVPR